MGSYYTLFSDFFELMVHKMFEAQRVVKPELKDGKTEWFMVTLGELEVGIMKIKQAMIRLYGDCGLDADLKTKKLPC